MNVPIEIVIRLLWEADENGAIVQLVNKEIAELTKKRYILSLHNIPILHSNYREYRKLEDVYVLSHSNSSGTLRLSYGSPKDPQFRQILFKFKGNNIHVHNSSIEKIMYLPKRIHLQNIDPFIAYKILKDKYTRLEVENSEGLVVNSIYNLIKMYENNYGSVCSAVNLCFIACTVYPQLILVLCLILPNFSATLISLTNLGKYRVPLEQILAMGTISLFVIALKHCINSRVRRSLNL